MCRVSLLLSVLAGVSLSAVTSSAQAQTVVSNQSITDSIKKAVDWIYLQQNPWGTWEEGPEPRGTQRDLPDEGQFGETTALALQALLAAGESDRQARLQQAIDFLFVSEHIAGVYAVGLRSQVWPLLTPAPAVRQAMARDRNTLLAAMHARGMTRGLFSYRTDYENETDQSSLDASLCAVMGMRSLTDGGIELPDDFWRSAQRAWRVRQRRDGSWAERSTTRPSISSLAATAAGTAVLCATDDELVASRPVSCTPAPPDRYMDSGLNWIDTHFDRVRDPIDFLGQPLRNYGLYVIARIGAISGRKYFNQRDWYQDGAEILLDSQDPQTGAWGNLTDTCYAVLFLVGGRDPVIVSKLQYAAAPSGTPASSAGAQRLAAAARTGSWNLRPRDMANLAWWMGEQSERQFNWETVTLKVPVEELHDSAVLYMAGNQPLNLPDDDKARLALFIQEGGLVVGSADCGAKSFTDGFRKLGTELFPAYEFRAAPRESVIFTNEEYRAAKWKDMPQVLELNNGVRDLMLLIPDADPSRFFQIRQIGSRQYLYELMADILLYGVDENDMRLKGDTYIVRPDPSARVTASEKTARLQYDGNWDPEPAGWTRMAAVMHNTRGIDLQTSPVRLGDGKLDGSFKLAHLTGTAGFHLNDAARGELRDFVRNGGVLVIDAAGGSTAFDLAAQAEIKAIFPDNSLDTLSPDHPVFSSGEKLTTAAYRRFARLRLGQADRFRLQGFPYGSGSVFYSAEDLTEGLVGEPIDGVYGYQPQVATSLMANLLTFAAK